MRIVAPLNALLHFALLLCGCFVLPIVAISYDKFLTLSVLNAVSFILALGFGFIQIRGMFSYWSGFIAGTLLGCVQLAAGVFAILGYVDWSTYGGYAKACLVIESILPLVVMCYLVVTLAGGVALEINDAMDWFCDLFKAKKDFRGKHVLVTGGGTGLGQALAVQFASLGANVTILSRSMKHLEETKEMAAQVVTGTLKYGEDIASLLVEKPAAGSNFAEVYCCECDVTKPEMLEEKLKDAVSKFGQFDVVVTCAGFSRPKYLVDSTADDYRMQMELNYMGTVNTVKATLPHMLEKGKGSYIIVSSALALMGSIGYTGYCGSKFAVRGFADALRMELLPHGISVHQFYPANMDTPGYAEENKTKPVEAKMIDESAEMVTPEVAGVACMNGFLRDYPSIDNAPIEIGTVRIMGNGITPRSNPFREFMYLPVGFIAGHIVGQSFDDTVAAARKKSNKKPGTF